MNRTITVEEIRNLIIRNNNELVYKLMKSEFFTPIKKENDSTVINTVSDDENVFIRLFDSLDVYRNVETEIEPLRFPFELIFDFLKDKIDGFILYIGSKEFILDDIFIAENILPYKAEDLKEIQDNLAYSNEPVSDSIFLTMLCSDEDYSSRASDGIIESAQDMYFEMATTQIDGKYYHLLFTSKEHLKNSFELFPGCHHYSQIIDLAQLAETFKETDISGILIDFPDEFHIITTEQLLKLDIKENVKLRNSLDYVLEV